MNYEIPNFESKNTARRGALAAKVYTSLKLDKVLSKCKPEVRKKVSDVIASTALETMEIFSISPLPRFGIVPETKQYPNTAANISFPHQGEKSFSATIRYKRGILRDIATTFEKSEEIARWYLQNLTAHEAYHIRARRLFPSHYTKEALQEYGRSPWEKDREELAADIFAAKYTQAKLKKVPFYHFKKYGFQKTMVGDIVRMKKIRKAKGY